MGEPLRPKRYVWINDEPSSFQSEYEEDEEEEWEEDEYEEYEYEYDEYDDEEYDEDGYPYEVNYVGEPGIETKLGRSSETLLAYFRN